MTLTLRSVRLFRSHVSKIVLSRYTGQAHPFSFFFLYEPLVMSRRAVAFAMLSADTFAAWFSTPPPPFYAEKRQNMLAQSYIQAKLAAFTAMY